MKRLILAAVIAIGATLSLPIAEATAASVSITPNGVVIRDGGHQNYREHRRHYRDGRNYGRRHYGYRQHCGIRTVKTYRHHRVVFKQVRVCR